MCCRAVASDSASAPRGTSRSRSGLGFPFPPVAERFRELEETMQICLQMWSDSEEPYEGAIWQLERTLNSPQSISRPHPYLMIGGGGEKKTLRLVAQYADACNLGVRGDLPTHKLDVLRGHCDDVGRDYDDIEKTAMIAITPESTATDAATVPDARGARLHGDVCLRGRDRRAGARRRR